MCTIIVLIAYAIRGEEILERENREEAHQTEEEERGTEQVFSHKLQTGSLDSDICESVSQCYVERATLTGREGEVRKWSV